MKTKTIYTGEHGPVVPMDKSMHSEFEEQRAVVLTNIARPIVKNDLVAAFASDEDLLIYEHFFIRGMEHINYQVSELLKIIDNNNGVHSDSELETIKKCRSIPSESLRSELQKLQQWKKEQMQVWGPVLDYMQKHPELSIGESISKRVLEFLKEREKLKELNAELVEGLKMARDLMKTHVPSSQSGLYVEWIEARDIIESLIKKSKES